MKPKKKIPTTIKNPELVRKRHESLFQAALKLFSKNGYHSTSVRQLSKESGIPLGTIYEYIGKKEDILLLVYQKVHEIVLEKTKEHLDNKIHPLEKLAIMIGAELRIVDQYQDLVLIVYQEAHGMAKSSLKETLLREQSHIDSFKKVLEEGIELGVFAPCNTTAVANIIRLMTDGWALKRWSLRGKVSLDEMNKSIMNILQDGIVITKKKENTNHY